MKFSRLKSIICVISVGVMCFTATGCTSKQVTSKGKDSSSAYVYKHTATCSGGDTAPNHANQVQFVDAQGQPSVYFLSDFYINLIGSGSAVRCYHPSSGNHWSGSLSTGQSVTIKSVRFTVGSQTSTLDLSLYIESVTNSGSEKIMKAKAYI